LNSKITLVRQRDQFIQYWETLIDVDIPTVIDWDEMQMKHNACVLIRDCAKDFGLLDLNLRWSEGEQKVLAAIAARLNLPPKPPDSAK